MMNETSSQVSSHESPTDTMHQAILIRWTFAWLASCFCIDEPRIAVGTDQGWPFTSVRRPAVPGPSSDHWSNNAIDRFVLDKLQRRTLHPNPPATKRELIRRAYFDLIGLPPTPDQVQSFEQDESPNALERVIDSLLARPSYGERWGRHWLDVVRYAQTNGYERDGEKLNAWRYRDYVIRAFNEDKPYDRFVMEQLAGDELDPVTDDSLIATGFYRLGVWDDEPDDARMAEFEALDDVMVTTGATFLGLTVACARCHDHKFDPIPQEDYYKLLAFFRGVRPYANPTATHDSATFLALGDRATVAKRLDDARNRSQVLRDDLAKTEDAKEKKRLQDEIAKIEREATGDLEWALGVRDGEAKPTHLLIRGNVATPGPEVEPAFLTLLGGGSPHIQPPSHQASSGRRLAIARWIARSDHPLTARVMANRVWQHHFGRGLVQSTSDFGHSGIAPTNPELLDWLATELITSGWSIKHLHRTIMLSKTYQMSSRIDPDRSANAQEVDPANNLYWRQNLRRLEAESIRDSLLAVSGDLELTPGGRGFFPHTAGEVLAAGSRPGDGWATSPPNDRVRRSIYAFVKRSMIPPLFEGFDYSNTAAPLGERPTTTVAPQALMLLNDPFVRDQAHALASRLECEAGSEPADRIKLAYWLALGRAPAPSEIQLAQRYLERQEASFAAIASRLTFTPDVPISLHRPYMNQLKSTDFLLGPRNGWAYYRGRWGRDYEGITTLDRACTPFALWQGTTFTNAVLTAAVTMSKGVESASLLLRANPDGEVFQGYEVHFDAREQSIVIRRHAKEIVALAQAKWRIPIDASFSVRIEIAAGHIRLWCNSAGQRDPESTRAGRARANGILTETGAGDALLTAIDSDPLVDPGRLGVSAWGASVSLDQLSLEHDGTRHEIGVSDESSVPRIRALESFCLLLFNLNEFIYID